MNNEKPPIAPSGGETVTVEEVIIEKVGDDIVIEEIIEIVEFGREKRPVPRAKGYAVLVDRERIVFEHETVTGREILTRAHKVPPEKYVLRQFFAGGAFEKIELDQEVHLRRHGLERFKTMPKTAQDG